MHADYSCCCGRALADAAEPVAVKRAPWHTSCQPIMSVLITRVGTRAQLEGILALHTANLRRNLSAEEIRTQGFVSAEYTREFLERMHAASPSIIAVDGDTVVG